MFALNTICVDTSETLETQPGGVYRMAGYLPKNRNAAAVELQSGTWEGDHEHASDVYARVGRRRPPASCLLHPYIDTRDIVRETTMWEEGLKKQRLARALSKRVICLYPLVRYVVFPGRIWCQLT